VDDGTECVRELGIEAAQHDWTTAIGIVVGVPGKR
jgi:hypothetical protein